MTATTTRRRAAAALLGTAMIVGAAWPSSAAAAADELEVVVAGGGPLFDLARIAPGSTGSTAATATNNTPEAGGLVVRATGLIEDENGCNRQEAAAGDITCGADGGELGDDLLVSVTADGERVFVGPAADLAAAYVDLGVVRAGETVNLDFGYEFDPASGNRTQTDRLAFDVEFVLTQDLGTHVAGARITDPSGLVRAMSQVTGAPLPRTGSDLGAVTTAGAASVSLGGLVLGARRFARRQR